MVSNGSNRLKKTLYAFSSLNDLGRVITSCESAEEVIKSGLYLVLGTLSSSQGVVFHYMSGSSRMEMIAWKGFEKDHDVSFPISRKDLQDLLLSPHVVDVHQAPTALEPFLTRNRKALEGIKPSLLVPLRVGEKVIGLLGIGERFGGGEYSEEDVQILITMSQQISVALYNHKLFSRLQRKVKENTALYENLRQIYHDTIEAFATAIDAKDEYTRGHSARVAQYAVAIGKGLGLPEDELEGLRLAGLLHDIGKITVDSSIIRKNDSLNANEIREMNRHPSIGYEILSNIKFPWGDLSTLARHHHEKVDGNGYPDGLHGEDLLLGARIITMADAFDAMTSDRPYRAQIGLEETLLEIKRCTGTQFDANIAEVLFRVLRKELTSEGIASEICPFLRLDYDPECILHVLEEVCQPSEIVIGPECVKGERSVYDCR
jgi:putative nucleotidyltransferase with HDIG domain